MNRAEIVLGQVSGHYWQTVAEVHRRLEILDWDWSKAVTRSVLDHLVTAGLLTAEVRKGRVSTGVPGCWSERPVKMYRVLGNGQDSDA